MPAKRSTLLVGTGAVLLAIIALVTFLVVRHFSHSGASDAAAAPTAAPATPTEPAAPTEPASPAPTTPAPAHPEPTGTAEASAEPTAPAASPASPTRPSGPTAPFAVRDDITDQAGVLGDRTAQVQAALDQLQAETNFRLFVVFVERFDRPDGSSWAVATAQESHLTPNDVLLAVAVRDQLYGFSYDTGSNLTEAQMTAVDRAVEAALTAAVRAPAGQGDWAAAPIAAANVLAGRAAGTSS